MESSDVQQQEQKVCTFKFHNSATSVKWTAYKTNAKIGVGGRFQQFTVSGVEEAPSPVEVVKNASIVIQTASVNTNDATGTRDPKIIKSFFGAMQNPDTLSGKIKEMNEDGTGILTLKMNGTESDVPVTHKMVDDTMKISGVLNLENWNGQDAVASLNKVCKDLHTGDDGVSKLWPEVAIDIQTIFTKDCD